MKADLWSLYRRMLWSRLFEEAVARLWEEGLISGEMHLGVGEEAIVAGVVDQLVDGDAMALDHRGTPPLLMRGVDPVSLLREFLGRPEGLCAGKGGHMHLYSPAHLSASSGIVGASGPAAAGFALAAQTIRQGSVAVSFFGEAAMNQGMLLESMNLAVVWNLPVLFVCKDNGWAIMTRSSSTIAGDLTQRAGAFGLFSTQVDGTDVDAVWRAAKECVDRVRRGVGPAFLHARCVHLEGHFLGDALLRSARQPVRGMIPMLGPLLRAVFGRKGLPVRERVGNLGTLLSLSRSLGQASALNGRDPLARTRNQLQSAAPRLAELESAVTQEVQYTVELALASV